MVEYTIQKTATMTDADQDARNVHTNLMARNELSKLLLFSYF